MKFLLTIILPIGFSFNLYSQITDFPDADFRKADSVANVFTNHSLKDLKSLAEKLTGSFSKEEEKFRAIYFWVCNNIESDYQYYRLNEKQRTKFRDQPDQLDAWNTSFSKRVFDRLLHEKKTVCTGYAYLIKALSFWAGLECIVVDGYGRSVGSNVGGSGTPNHSWNAVRIKGKWYVCDATWSSGTVIPETGVFIKNFDEAYFLPAPEIFVQHHFPLDTALMFLRDKPMLYDFLEAPIVYTKAYAFEVIPVFPETFHVSATKGQSVSFQFKAGSSIPITNVALQVNGRIIHPEIHIDEAGRYTIEHRFKNKRKHIVHLLLNSNYISSYTIRVW